MTLLFFSFILLLISQTRINNQIKADKILVIDEVGKNMGQMSLNDALKMAQEKGLDLIEIAPNAKPPVTRIMNFDKFRYQQDKKERKQKAGEKALEVKQVQVSIRSAKNDLEFKAEKVKGFMNKGHQV